MIAIADIGSGNFKSLENALNYLKHPFEIVKPLKTLNNYSHLIVPGVGNFFKITKNINEKNYIKYLLEFKNTKKPILGICLGMQLFATTGMEGGCSKGLNFIDGTVNILDVDIKKFQLPHVGWNEVIFVKNHKLFEKIENNMDFYFVHSYKFLNTHPDDQFAITNYHEKFTSIIIKDNVVGVQFHPEKSQSVGLKFLDNFCNWKYYD